MAGGNVRVGVAYIDVRLGELKQFWGQLKKEVERNGPQVGRQLGDEVAKRLSVKKGDFKSLTDAIGGAIKDSGIEANRLREVLRETGRQGGDAFLREFTPLLRAALKNSGIEGRDRLLEAFDAGDISPRLIRTFQQALTEAVGAADDTASQGGERTGRSFAEGFGRGVRRANEALGAFSQRLGLLSFQVTSLGFTMSAAFSAPVAAITALAAAVGIQSATIIEDATVAFTTLLGTQERADRFLRTLRDFAASSPIFDLDNVIQFSRNLLGAGVRAERIIPTLTALSSIAAAYGLDQEQLNRALRGFTQSLLLGRVFQEELNQITEAGIPIYDLLAKAFGKTKQEIQKLVTDKEISPEQLFDQIVKLGNSGQFLTGLQQRASTLTGVWQQFKETLQANLADALTPQLPRIKEFLRTIDQSLQETLRNSGPFFDAVLDAIERLVRGLELLSNAYNNLSPDQREFVNDVILIATAAGPAVIAAGALAGAVSTLASSFGFLIGLLGTPWGAATAGAVVAIGLVVLAFREAYESTEDFRASVDALIQTGRDIRDALVPDMRELGRVVQEELKPAFDELMRVVREEVLPPLRDFSDRVGPKIVSVFQTVSDYALVVLPTAFRFLVAVFRQQVIPAFEEVLAVYNRHRDTLGPLIDLLTILAKIVGVVLVSGLSALLVILGLLAGVWAVTIRIVALSADIFLTIVGWLRRLWEWLRNTGREAQALGGAFSLGVRAAQEQVNKLTTAARGLPGKIKSAVGDLGKLLYQAGRNLIQGLINGIDSRAGGLLSKLAGLAAKAKALFDQAFSFGSPSKVTFQWGEWIVEGLQGGIDKASQRLQLPAAIASVANVRPVAPDTEPVPQGVTTADIVRALQGVVVTLDGRAVGRIEGRRADLIYRGR